MTTVGAAVTFEVDADEVDRMLADVQHAVSPPSMQAFLLARAARYLQQITAQNFATETAPDGNGWLSLREATRTIRSLDGFPSAHPINQRTGEFKGWLTGSWGDAAMTGDGAELSWPSKGDTELEAKLKVAQVGSKRGENPNFPSSQTARRPVVGVDEADMVSVLLLLGDHLQQMLGGTSNIGDFL